jgi:hypothetical protein
MHALSEKASTPSRACCNCTTFHPENDIEATFRSTLFEQRLSWGLPTMGIRMFRLFSSAMLVTVAVVGDALAFVTPVGVPAPEIGGGMVGTVVAAGVVYLINRRRSRS